MLEVSVIGGKPKGCEQLAERTHTPSIRDAKSIAYSSTPAILFDEKRKITHVSPVKTSWVELKSVYARSEYRLKLANQFEYWLLLCAEIIEISNIWIGGSFCSDTDYPRDIDVVVFYRPKTGSNCGDVPTLQLQNFETVFTNAMSKQNFGVDSALVSLSLEPSQLAHVSAFWTLVFSHDSNRKSRTFYSVEGSGLRLGHNHTSVEGPHK
jgi:hypothetical protein